MHTTEVVITGDGQVVRLPQEFQFATNEVLIRRDGDAVILEPMPRKEWPQDFFEHIRIEDPLFQRPEQGTPPPLPPISIG